MKTKNIYIFFLIFAAQSLFGQGGSAGINDARSAGMGKTSVVTANGLFSTGSNPANIFQGSSTKAVELIISFPVPTVSGRVGTSFLSLNDYNYFFGEDSKDENGDKVGKYLTESDKSRLNELFSKGGNVYGGARITLFGISITPAKKFGTIAFSINDVVSGNGTFPKDIVDLGLNGNTINRVYNFNDAKFTAWWLRKYSISFAKSLNIFPSMKEFTFGVSFNIVKGFAYASLDKVKTDLLTDEKGIITGNGEFLAFSSFSENFKVKYDFDLLSQKEEGKFSPFPKPAGSGIGIDFGFNAKLNDIWSIGLAFTDIGKVKWTENVAEFNSQNALFLDDITNEKQRDSLVDNITGKGSGKYINEITTDLAKAMFLGVSIQLDKMFSKFPGKMLMAVAFSKGFNDQPGNTTKPAFAVGFDWNLSRLLAFRTGFSLGGIEKFGWAMGLGLDFGLLEMNFGTPDMQNAMGSGSANRITFAFDSRWKF